MERYSLPTNNIEVVIGESKITAPEPIETNISHQTNIKKPQVTKSPVTSPKTPAVTNRKKIKPSHYVATRFLVLVGTIALVGNIPVYSKIPSLSSYDNDEQASAVTAESTLKSSSNKRLELNLPANVETYSGHSVDILPSTHKGKWLVHRIAKGDSLESILAEMNLQDSHKELTAHPRIRRQLDKISPDNKIFIQTENNKIKQLIYAIDRKKAYIVSQKDGEYQIQLERENFEKSPQRIALTIKQSLHAEAHSAGIPIAVTRQLSRIFKKDINFRRLRIGDQVSVIFNEYSYQGERLHTGKILAAEFQHLKKIHQRLLFTPADGKPRYIDPSNDLELKQVAFDRRPLRTGRLSSGFGFRRHPIFGSRKFHTGIDIAAPRGTPIYATGKGTVRHVGRKGGYGKTVVLSHAGNIQTLYGHMSRYKKGLRVGQKVKRGSIIGYVGSTGRSTGNHIHYEYRVKGKSVNPLTVKLPSRGVFSKKEMQKFKKQAKNMTSELIKLRETASIERNVRQEFGG